MGAVSAGAMVLSMSAISAFAADYLTTVTIGDSTHLMTMDGATVIKKPDSINLRYGTNSSTTLKPGTTNIYINEKYTVSNGILTVSFGATEVDLETGKYIAFVLIPDNSNIIIENAFKCTSSPVDASTASTSFTDMGITMTRATQEVTVTINDKDIGGVPVTSLTNAKLIASAIDECTGVEHKVEVSAGMAGKFDFDGSSELRRELEYSFTLNSDPFTIADISSDGKNIVFDGKLAVDYGSSTITVSIEKSSANASASNDPAKIKPPTAGQSYAPISPVVTVASGNPAQDYITNELKNNTNFASAIAGSNANNYFLDVKTAQEKASYSQVHRVNDSSLFASNITTEQYLNLVGTKLTEVTNDIIMDNEHYVVKVTFPRETINPAYTNEVIVSLVGSSGAPNMNDGVIQTNTVLTNGNKTVSAEVTDLVARLNSGNLKSTNLLTLNDKNDKTLATFTLNATGNVTAENVQSAVDSLSTYIANSNGVTGNNAWNAFVKENPEAKAFPFQFTKDTNFNNFNVTVTLNNIPSNVTSGDLYKEVNGKLVKQSSYTVSGNKATFTLNGCSNYRLVYGNLDTTVLAAGEGANDSVTEISAESF